MAAAPGQFTTMGELFTVSCPEPITLLIVARIATGPPVLTLVARPLLPFTVATVGLALVQLGAGAEAITLPRAPFGVALDFTSSGGHAAAQGPLHTTGWPLLVSV